MKEYTPEYLEHIREVIHTQNIEVARQELEGLHPADIAELYQNLNLKEAEFLYDLLDEDTAADKLNIQSETADSGDFRIVAYMINDDLPGTLAVQSFVFIAYLHT